MPLTPFHFGPGVLIKSVAIKHFDLRTFIVSQIIMDMETAWNILNDNLRLHTFFHSYIGAIIVAGLSCLTMQLFFMVNKRWIVSMRLVLLSSLVGSVSHVFLDSIMHIDMMPWVPLSQHNPSLQSISLVQLHLLCVISALIGGIIWMFRYWHSSKRIKTNPRAS